MIETELLDYYSHFCELTIWFKKLILYSNSKAVITVKDVAKEFIAERNKILTNVPIKSRRDSRRNLNKIATSYYARVSRWSLQQKITLDMV